MTRSTLLIHALLFFLLGTASLAQVKPANTPRPVPGEPFFRPEPRVVTPPMPHSGDAADDPAIWLHPANPDLSLILGTDKQGGLHSYNLDGSLVEIVSPDARPNNVDILYGFPLDGRPADLAVASTRAPKHLGVMVWRIDPDSRKLIDITSSPAIPVLKGKDVPYGICTYHSAKTGRCFFFVNDKLGNIEQFELSAESNGKTSAKLVRAMKLKSIVEGCVADDELGNLYVAEETVGIWEFAAEPDAATSGKLITRVKENGLTADVEGLTIYAAARGKGYLIASSQGSNNFKIYRREGNHEFVGTIQPKPGRSNSPRDTDGIAAISAPLGKLFPKGCLVVQDGYNKSGNQNFKLYGWEDIAGEQLLIDTTIRPRGKE